MPSSAAAIVFATAASASTVLDIKQQKEIAKAQEKQQQVDIATQNEKASRARRATIKEAMVKRAQIENVAGATGQSKSSAVAAGTQQVTGDAAENIGSINTSLALSSAATAAQGAVNKAQQTSPLQAIAGVAQQGALASQSFKS